MTNPDRQKTEYIVVVKMYFWIFFIPLALSD